jgi:hypothetical protein
MATISYTTNRYTNLRHEVVLRNSIDTWGVDYHGNYTNGAWEFALDGPRYAQGFEFKFYLGGVGWADGANLKVDPSQAEDTLSYSDATVTFHGASSTRAVTIAGLNLPTWFTTGLSLLAGALSVLNQTTFGFPAPWGTSLTIALLFLSGLGISPLVGARFQNALHLSPRLSLAISTALAAAGAAALTIDDKTARAIVVGILTFLAGLGFGPKPAQA